MINSSWRMLLLLGLAVTSPTMNAFAQEHKWAGRTLDDVEWSVHEKLAGVPSQTVFDSLKFEVRDKTVTLTGQVTKDRLKENAERAVKQLPGIDKIVNDIEVLPSSRRDDALRMSVYRAIYENRPLDVYGTHESHPIHIVVKNGWVFLEGVVDSDTDRNTAHLQVLKVTPHVSDNLRVSRTSS